ncbi:alpha/beta hydrolase [Dactylosporangium salmoneum]|uniref:Alpha/beta hydrolase n=1 Tax=Dactylosporangium salmoneum TaxID=53361 RepID=A0ABP5UC57_9ACTN
MDATRLMVDAVALLWPELPDEPDGFADAALVALRELDRARREDTAAEPAARQGVLDAFATRPAALARLREVSDRLVEAELGRGLESTIPGAVEHERYVEIPVYYATDRAPTGKTEPGERYGGERGELTFGVARVSIPDDHRMGALEKPRLWRLEFRQNPDKHVVLLGLEELDDLGFAARAKAATDGGDVLLFVHGYNVGFADAARRAAQLAYDLNFAGVPMLYSWPSRAQTAAYLVDQNNSMWTHGHFMRFLRLVLDGLGAARVHTLAHSMGNRVLTDGLAALGPDPMTPVGQVVFAAPDVDAGVFEQLAAAFAGLAARCTLYASDNDRALWASKGLVDAPRAGQAGAGILVVDGVDTVDASELDTGLLGHSYYGDRTRVLSDVFSLIRHGLPPGERFGMRGRTNAAGRGYWLFSPQAD